MGILETNYEFLLAHGDHPNFRLKIEDPAVGFASWSVDPATAECPIVSGGERVIERDGDLVCRNTPNDIIVLQGASFVSEVGATGSGELPESVCSEDGWTWLLDSKE